ncbi:sensor histidine kinase [Pseudodesulfovibrio sediminis]|uniref:histidine kinase n=1 Tax=Pseudodesulfovibrio sediminis TaxID=2810563 RepID=A0ABN6EME2_9BACT|nr:ATP-binding protein [Pseudodesulfovibrio sediminis]BCS87218.1 hypothetical protein PSDVSF_04600 [Pseudodesulfovibrio sediminis]
MDTSLITASGLIFLGALIMLANILSYQQNIKETDRYTSTQDDKTRHFIRIHHLFMAFFLLGYLGVLYLFMTKVHTLSALFVSIIFLFGAIFVHMSVVIQKRMFRLLQAKNDHLEHERTRLISINNQLQEEIDGRIKAEQSDQKKSNFLSLVSHELRTPLTSIFGFTKLISKGVANLPQSIDGQNIDKIKKRMAENLNIVSNECCRLTRLINNVLDLAKIESGQMEWLDTDICLKDAVESALNSLAGMFVNNAKVYVCIDIPQDAPVVRLDADLFTQVLINIISNAVKFSEEGELSVRMSSHEEGVLLSITDQGQGIPQENLSDIFDKFYIVRSGDTLGEKRQGTGLGLPICQQIIKHYNGRIWAESNIGEGSTFHILLPDAIIVE